MVLAINSEHELRHSISKVYIGPVYFPPRKRKNTKTQNFAKESC